MKCQHPICQFAWVVIMSTSKLVFAGFEVSIWDSHCRHHKQHTGSIESTFVKFPMLQTWNEFGQQVEWRLKSGWFPHWGAYWPSSSASRGASVASLVRWSWSPYCRIRLSHSYVGPLKVWSNCISNGSLSFHPSFNAFRKRILVLVWILAWYAGLLSGKPHHCDQIRIHHTRTEPWIDQNWTLNCLHDFLPETKTANRQENLLDIRHTPLISVFCLNWPKLGMDMHYLFLYF